MDFELSKAQKDIQKAARDFAKGEFDKELAAELEAKHEFPVKVWQKAGELGFIGIHYPEAYGGQDFGCLENALVVEEFCRGDSSIGTALMLCDFASENVLRYGTDEQKKAILQPIAYGEKIFGGAITEPDHGIGHHRHGDDGREGRRLLGHQRRQDLHHERRHRPRLHGALPDRSGGRPSGADDDPRAGRRRGARDPGCRPEDGHPAVARRAS